MSACPLLSQALRIQSLLRCHCCVRCLPHHPVFNFTYIRQSRLLQNVSALYPVSSPVGTSWPSPCPGAWREPAGYCLERAKKRMAPRWKGPVSCRDSWQSCELQSVDPHVCLLGEKPQGLTWNLLGHLPIRKFYNQRCQECARTDGFGEEKTYPKTFRWRLQLYEVGSF